MTSGPLSKVANVFSGLAWIWCRPWIGVILVYIAAFWERSSLPWLPLADPDTWGYLKPSLEHLAGNGLIQTNCRDIAYPLFLRLVLGTTGDFPSIAVVQHLLGLASGLVWLVAFRLWLAWLPKETGEHYGSRWFGVLCLALYLCNPATLVFESRIRPEAIFPFFGLGQIAATLAFAHDYWRKNVGISACIMAFLAVLLALICVSLKPSWGFAAAVPLAAVAFGVFGIRRVSWVRAVSMLVAAIVAAVLWLAIIPRLARWVPDLDSGYFLAATLFTVHANIIADEMHDREIRGELDAEETWFLHKLDIRIAESRALKKSVYRVLGHDPDYLFYSSDTLFQLPHVPANSGSRQADISYLRGAYLRSVISKPLALAWKVIRQLWIAYKDANKSLFTGSVSWRSHFERTPTFFDQVTIPAVPPHIITSLRQSLRDSRDRAASQPEELAPLLEPPDWLLRGPVTWLLVFLAFGGVLPILFLTRRMNDHMRWMPAFYAFAVVWVSSFGAALTVAIVHSFDIGRYLMAQSSTNALLLACGVSFCASILKHSWQTRVRRFLKTPHQ